MSNIDRRHAMIRAARKGAMFGRLDRFAPKPRPFSAENLVWLADEYTGDFNIDADIRLVYRSAYRTAYDRARAAEAVCS